MKHICNTDYLEIPERLTHLDPRFSSITNTCAPAAPWSCRSLDNLDGTISTLFPDNFCFASFPLLKRVTGNYMHPTNLASHRPS